MTTSGAEMNAIALMAFLRDVRAGKTVTRMVVNKMKPNTNNVSSNESETHRDIVETKKTTPKKPTAQNTSRT